MLVNENDNANTNSNNVIFNVIDTKFCVPVITLSAKDNQNYQNFLVHNSKDQFIGMNIKQKMKIKIQQMSTDIFLNQTL